MAKILYQDGLCQTHKVIEIPPSPRPAFQSCYVFALPKSGSVLLNNITTALMKEAEVPIVDIPTFCFSNGIAADTALFDFDQIFKATGYCYSGFRRIPPNMRGTLHRLLGNKIVMVRDPRDMLVSLYYSMKFSHTYPPKGTLQFFSMVNDLRGSARQSIDDFCISNIDLYLALFRQYLELFEDSTVKTLRYEDYIFDKPALARTICDWFSLDIDATRVDETARLFDVLPTEDKPLEHIRQVRPGDHKRKLEPATIELLDALLGTFMRRFGYLS